MLHVTNGDAAAERLREAGFEGSVLPWRDVLHEGPVPANLGPKYLRAARARFLAGQGWTTYEAALHDQTERDAILAQAGRQGAVVLWFEHDLYDQLQLLQVLCRLAPHVEARLPVALACEARYLASASPEALHALYDRRVSVGDAHVDTARRAWSAFRAHDPSPLVAEAHGAECPALPFVAAALRRHLEEFPDDDGLSRSERQALAAFAEGPRVLAEAYHAAHHECEEPVFLTDLVFASYLARLSSVPTPLLTFEQGEPIRSGAARAARPGAFWSRRAVLTDAGRAVLRGDADHLTLNAPDRWLGGVHLRGRHAWRRRGGRLLPPPS